VFFVWIYSSFGFVAVYSCFWLRFGGLGGWKFAGFSGGRRQWRWLPAGVVHLFLILCGSLWVVSNSVHFRVEERGSAAGSFRR
jgi:hypothetical protein